MHEIRRLDARDAPAIVDCFLRVYGNTYANDLFHDSVQLADAIASQRLMPVGAVDDTGKVIAHMAMTTNEHGNTPELGNTVVDPEARGGGLAWQVGQTLIDWCREQGNAGFVHYPTTDHHIMQRQAVENGIETGLMLGYIPDSTDGKVNDHRSGLRQAATIVYQLIDNVPPALTQYRAGYFDEDIAEMANHIGLTREFIDGDPIGAAPLVTELQNHDRRGLSRLTVYQGHEGFEKSLAAFSQNNIPCLQLDLAMGNPSVAQLTQTARAAGFIFCGWIPHFAGDDVLRLQKVSKAETDWNPNLVNPAAQSILEQIKSKTSH